MYVYYIIYKYDIYTILVSYYSIFILWNYVFKLFYIALFLGEF